MGGSLGEGQLSRDLELRKIVTNQHWLSESVCLSKSSLDATTSLLFSPQGPRGRQVSRADTRPLLMRCVMVCHALCTKTAEVAACCLKPFAERCI